MPPVATALPLAGPDADPAAGGPTTAPRLRLLAAPSCEPPYDDELPTPALRLVDGPVLEQPTLTLLPLGRVPLHVVPRPDQPKPDDSTSDDGAHDDVTDDADVAVRRTASDELPSPHRFSHALLQRLLEVLAGVRPLGQLQRDLTFEAFEDLERRYLATQRTPGPRPTARAVRSVHLQARPEGVAEVCASVLRGDRRVALALRLEGRDGSWRCTDLVGV